MHFVEKEGRRLAVLDYLVSTETGQYIEIPITSSEMEASMLWAGELCRRRLKGFLDPRDPSAAQFHPDNGTNSATG